MAAYLIALRERVRDPEEMKMYAEKAKALDFSKAKRLAMFGKRFQNLENAPFEGAVILEFPTVEDAQAWYDSPEYTDARQHRLKGADYKFMIVEGL